MGKLFNSHSLVYTTETQTYMLVVGWAMIPYTLLPPFCERVAPIPANPVAFCGITRAGLLDVLGRLLVTG